MNKFLSLLNRQKIKVHQLEEYVTRSCYAPIIRREWYKEKFKLNFKNIPYIENVGVNYDKYYKKNCENIVGYVPIPIGLAGPLKINQKLHFIPMATTEGTLVASINRGCKVLNESNGVNTLVFDKGISRAPIIELDSLMEVKQMIEWLNTNLTTLQKVFSETSRYGKLIRIEPYIVGTRIHIRFSATTGDAMGMNIITKGCEHMLKYMKNNYFPKMRVLTLSGNCCTDKKATAMNWINGRGKTSIAEAKVSEYNLKKYLNIDIDTMIKLNTEKNLIGSALAGSIGGNNAHAANIVAGIYASTGQDLAQIGTSSMCLLHTEKVENNILKITANMPSIEVATVGGGTHLSTQQNCLELMGIEDSRYLWLIMPITRL